MLTSLSFLTLTHLHCIRKTSAVLTKKMHKIHSKGLLTNFKYITFFLCINKKNIFYERSISIKQLWLEIIKRIGCSKPADRVLLYMGCPINLTNFEIAVSLAVFKVFFVSQQKKHFYKRSISIKQLWNEITEHHFSQLLRVTVVLSRWTFF